MFGDLLTLSRIDAAHNPLPLYRMPLLPIVSEAVEKHKSLWRSKRIQVDVSVPEALWVVGNREALGHIVGNLVHNAIKYSFEDGVVTVRAAARDRWALVEVIDLGIGIDRAHHERIFDRFYRVDKGRARSVGGTGLGLAIVKKLVDALGAAIEVRSKPGAGSIFRLLLTLGLEEHQTEPVEVDCS
jgi:two-component system phosphate regulon sensor histidine kinase PhoR